MNGRKPNAFTLVELLVVIGVLAILATVLLTTASSMWKSARAAASQQRIGTLVAAITQYHNDYRSYPGPLSDETILGRPGGAAMPAGTGTNRRITASENLVLGLLGGLRLSASGWVYDIARVGEGPWNASASSSPGKAYLNLTVAKPMMSGGLFADEAGQTALDTAVPEFVDVFDNPLPILYLRSRPDAPGIMSNLAVKPTDSENRFYQYDHGQIAPYVSAPIGLKDGQTHGLSFPTTPNAAILGFSGDGLNNALQYFRQSTVNPDPDPEPASGATELTRPDRFNRTGTPRERNRFILISPGKDRIYGTRDDVASSGASSR